MRPRLVAEGIGSLLLAATVIGSGIMAERLAGGNVAIALIANTGATVAVLAALIALLGSGQRRALQPGRVARAGAARCSALARGVRLRGDSSRGLLRGSDPRACDVRATAHPIIAPRP